MKALAVIGLLSLAACDSGTTAMMTDGGDVLMAAGGKTGAGGAGGGQGDAGASCDPSYKCSAAITQPSGDPTKLCTGSVAASQFNTLNACVCGPACLPRCGDSVCAQKTPTLDCLSCIMDTTAGCGKELAACSAS